MDNPISYFDVNAAYGCTATKTPDFPEVGDLVAHLDYLGIDRALTCCHFRSPAVGNRKLLQDLDRSPEIRQRLEPAFIVAPSDMLHSETLSFYEQHLKSKRVKAVRLFAFVPQADRIINHLAPYKPLVLFSWQSTGDPPSIDAMASLAKAHPELTFICTDVMWGHYTALFDLMWQCPNMQAEISWMHVRDTLPLLIRQFGVERILFGTGPKAHYGAAIAGLTHSDITGDRKKQIASGNLEKLLDTGPVSTALVKNPPDILKKKPIWAAFREGGAVKDTKVIDAHGHLGDASPGWCMGDDMGSMNGHLMAHMDKVGVQHMVVSSTGALGNDPVKANQALAEDLGQYPERFSGYLTYNPHYRKTMGPVIGDFFKNRFFIGFKLHPDGWQLPVNNRLYNPAWEYANEYSLPVLIHTWDTPMNSPGMFKDIAGKYPKALFLLGHSGGGDAGRREAVDLARDNPNVILEFCGSFCSYFPWDETIAEVGIDRVVFGSDSFLHDLGWELGRLLSTPLPDRELTPILGKNMQRLLQKRSN